MRNVILFIAMSLDGYIADRNGGVDWLAGQDEHAETADFYAAFQPGIDTVVMGWNTYHQIVTELSPDEWVYAGLTSYVVTHREGAAPADGIVFTAQNPCDLVRELKQGAGKDIWICGGADIVQQLVEADLIDEYDISVIPTLLGGGIRLFGQGAEETKLRLIRTQVSNGMVELVYARRQAPAQTEIS